MAVKKYKPREVEAIQWTGKNIQDIGKFLKGTDSAISCYGNSVCIMVDCSGVDKQCFKSNYIVKYSETWFDVMEENEFQLRFQEDDKIAIPTFNPFFYKNCSTLLSRETYSNEEKEAIDRFDDLCKQMIKNDTIDAIAMAMKIKFDKPKSKVASDVDKMKSKLKYLKEIKSKSKFQIAAEPLIKYMAENHHPNCTCIVDSTHAEVLEGIKVHKTEQFITD